MYKQLNIILIFTGLGFGWLFFSNFGRDSDAKEKIEAFALKSLDEDLQAEIKANIQLVGNWGSDYKYVLDSVLFKELDSIHNHLLVLDEIMAMDTSDWIINSAKSLLSACLNLESTPEEWLGILNTNQKEKEWLQLKTSILKASYLRRELERMPPKRQPTKLDLLAHFDLNDSANFIDATAVNRHLIEIEQSSFNGKNVDISSDSIYQYAIDSILDQPNELKIHVMNQKTGVEKIYSNKLEFEVK